MQGAFPAEGHKKNGTYSIYMARFEPLTSSLSRLRGQLLHNRIAHILLHCSNIEIGRRSVHRKRKKSTGRRSAAPTQTELARTAVCMVVVAVAEDEWRNKTREGGREHWRQADKRHRVKDVYDVVFAPRTTVSSPLPSPLPANPRPAIKKGLEEPYMQYTGMYRELCDLGRHPSLSLVDDSRGLRTYSSASPAAISSEPPRHPPSRGTPSSRLVKSGSMYIVLRPP